MSIQPVIYSFDTSALIDGLERHYPMENFPAVWKNMDNLVNDGRLIISREVYDESIEKDLATKNWCKPRKDKIVIETDEFIGYEVTKVMDDFPNIVNDNKRKNRADPFVIGLAKAKKATVVTGEKLGKGIKIPDVCSSYRIDCITILTLIKVEGWIF